MRAAGADERTAALAPGACLGELALVPGGRRTATVAALGAAELLALPAAEYHRLLVRPAPAALTPAPTPRRPHMAPPPAGAAAAAARPPRRAPL